MSLSSKIDAVKQGKKKVVNELERYLQKANKITNLNAYISLLQDRAQKKADEIDERIKQGKPTGVLAGAIIAVKDNINIKDEITTCGSKILKSFKSPYNATVIKKLEAADAVIIGKTNLDEFAMGSSNETSKFGPVKNPHNITRVPGGSSGGSAVAVAAQTADAALGSDTGGSIRQPAAMTGIVGIKPSYGRVSRYGLVAYASSLDQIGPFARTVEDSSIILEQISGYDKNDSTSADLPVPEYQQFLDRDVKGVKIGLPDEYFAAGLDPHIREGILRIVDQLQNGGAEIQKIKLPITEYGIACYYILATAEASSNLARYDGVRYGLRIDGDGGLAEMYSGTRSEGFGDEVRRRIILGTYVLSAGYYEAYYKKAQKVRRLLKNEFDEIFSKLDAVITPTAPTTAFEIGEKIDDPLSMYLSDIYTVTANLAGICGISVPAGLHPNGLPYGIQVLAGAFQEEKLIQIGDFIDKNCKPN